MQDLEQDWKGYTSEQHAIWRTLFHRQEAILARRACQPFLDGLKDLGVEAEGIPDFRRLNDALSRATGWQIVAVPGLVPDDVFFEHLANRRFVAGQFHPPPRPARLSAGARRLPRRVRPCADAAHPGLRRLYAGLWPGRAQARCGLNALDMLARLYWYTVEFGLIATGRPAHLWLGHRLLARRIDLLPRDPSPNRIALRPGARDAHPLSDRRLPADLFRDRQLRSAVRATQPDFTPYYAAFEKTTDIEPGAVVEGDRLR